MATNRSRKTGRTSEPRVPRTPLSKLKAAKRALGAATATDTFEPALDLVVFQRQLMDGTRSMPRAHRGPGKLRSRPER